MRVRAGVSCASTEVAFSLNFLVGRFSLSDMANSIGLGVETEGLCAGNFLCCDVVNKLSQGLKLVIASPAQHSLLYLIVDEAMDDHLLACRTHSADSQCTRPASHTCPRSQ